jgi:uncharacterized OB-fold protein
VITQKVLPATDDPDSAPFWRAAKERRLVVQRCDGCGRLRFPPHPFCRACRSAKMSWAPVSGRGKIWSWAVIHEPTMPAFSEFVPFPVVIVTLDEAPHLRMTGNVVAGPGAAINSVPAAKLAFGAPVEVTFAEVAEDVTLPQWMLRG